MIIEIQKQSAMQYTVVLNVEQSLFGTALHQEWTYGSIVGALERQRIVAEWFAYHTVGELELLIDNMTKEGTNA